MEAVAEAKVQRPVKAKSPEGEERPQKRVKKDAVKSASSELIEIEKKIDALVGDATRVEWDIGSHLSGIYEHDLWQAASDSAGMPFSSFAAYVAARFDFSKQTARAFMRISQTFSREEASKIPIGHLRLLVQVPDDGERRKLADEVKSKATTFRELADKVKAQRAEAGLNTSRAGMEDQVHISVRLKAGVVTEGQWSKTKKRKATFELGSSQFELEDLGKDGFVVRLLG